MSAQPLFDIEPFRALTERHAAVRAADHSTVVLGSTQRVEIIDATRAAALGTEVVRRRGGGGAVLLLPADHLWIDAWIPRDDPLWDADVGQAAAWVGEWWRAGLFSLGLRGAHVHEGRAVPGRHGALVCFSGKGPGEVFAGGRKVMGVSQWRGREGALFHTCAYTRWDPRPLVDLLEGDPAWRDSLNGELTAAAVGVDEIDYPGRDEGIEGSKGAEGAIPFLRDVLLATFATWGEDRHPPV